MAWAGRGGVRAGGGVEAAVRVQRERVLAPCGEGDVDLGLAARRAVSVHGARLRRIELDESSTKRQRASLLCCESCR